MDRTTKHATAANGLSHAQRRAAADLLADIRAKLAATSDADKQADLLSLGIDLLRRRQRERSQEHAAWRPRARAVEEAERDTLTTIALGMEDDDG